MRHPRYEVVEELIRGAADVPSTPPPALRRRVLRSARQQQERRVSQRRVRWSIGASVVAITLAFATNSILTPRLPGAGVPLTGRDPQAAVREEGAADWSSVELFQRLRAERAGVIRGSF